MPALTSDSRVFVAGHRGLVGSAVVRRLAADGVEMVTRTSAELDLRDGAAVRAFFHAERPTHVVLAAAKVGGILANRDFPADFVGDNLAIAYQVLMAAHEAGLGQTGRVVNLGSSCIYPREAPQPMREEHLLTGPLEPTNRPYAVAKIAGIEIVESLHRQHGDDMISLMPTNLYGPGDNFDLQSSHVLPALIRRFYEAKGAGPDGTDAPVTLWGTGSPKREFLHADDLADAVAFVLGQPPRDDAPGGRARRAAQRGRGRGPVDPRAGRADPRGGRGRERDALGHRQARRDAPQAARREPAARPGLDGLDRPARRRGLHN